MNRTAIALICIFISVVTGLIYYCTRDLINAAKLPCQKGPVSPCFLNQKVTIVYTVRNIPEGAVIEPEFLEEREVLASKAPVDAMTSASSVAGRVAKYPIGAGQIVSVRDLRVCSSGGVHLMKTAPSAAPAARVGL